jgi:hypothetical protein
LIEKLILYSDGFLAAQVGLFQEVYSIFVLFKTGGGVGDLRGIFGF